MTDNTARGRPILPIKNTSRVTVWRGKVYMAPLGYACMGADGDGRVIASNGEDVMEMKMIGTVLDD